MRALLDDIAVLQHQNQVGVFNGGQPVGDDKAGAVLRQPVHGLLAGGSIVLLTYQTVGLTTAAYLAIPVAAPIALGGFYSYHGMSFYEVTRRGIRQLFFNRTLLYRSPERNETENRKKKKRQKKKRRGET